ncbi:MAG: DUF3786 domain-containing protein [Chloroflexota bacterium]
MSRPTSSQPDLDRFAQRIDELRSGLVHADPFQLAERTAVNYQPVQAGRGEFHFDLWGRPVRLDYPDFVAYSPSTGEPLASFHLALLLYYFSTADGRPLSNRWIAFTELPDGRFYTQAFQSYTGQELGRTFQNDAARFIQAARSLDGSPGSIGDASFAFQALPRAPLLVAFWQGDEDFPASFQLLFDASASHYLPTDAYAILGSTLTRRLISAAQALPRTTP